MDHQQQPLMVHPPQLPSREESHRRAIIHIDIDSFYAQVEVLLDPSLRGRPVGVQQKYLMVTCNYVARAAGVKKMQSVTGALQACPELIVKNGETLTKYREASERVQALLLGADVAPCVERLNLDECWLDVTAAADADAAAAPASNATTFAGHLYTPTASSTSSGHEFSDGTGDHDGGSSREGGGGGGSNSSSSGAAAECICGCVPRLAAASRIAARLRAILAAELGMTCCAGVGSSKMVAKLAAELHRPNDQSAILPQHAAAYVARVPLKKLPGCGHTTRTRLEPLLPPSPCAADLLGVPWEALVSALQEEGLGGGGAAQRLWLAAHGADPSPVSASGRPKSISQEDSYRKGLVTSMDHVKRELQKLTPDVLQRVQTRLREHGEAPSALRVGVRTRSAPGMTFRNLSIEHTLTPSFEHCISSVYSSAAHNRTHSVLRREARLAIVTLLAAARSATHAAHTAHVIHSHTA
eukprot:TRINITY_DN1674_c0_g1_i11.p1 TRINITY_DN1674_c0_g1~~TRINITY_DN1674_c0_g1_i11.p1  ORF type:complete len:470 (+),score=140.09 TRINITY_DN1674_c0_g1_i11:38-1447(+)